MLDNKSIMCISCHSFTSPIEPKFFKVVFQNSFVPITGIPAARIIPICKTTKQRPLTTADKRFANSKELSLIGANRQV